FQADFQARLDWCVRPDAEANHPPVVRIRGAGVRRARPGDEVIVDAGGSTDPDGDVLDFSWAVYPAIPDAAGKVVIKGQDETVARVVIDPELAGRTVPLLLSVTDRGVPRLTRYGRVLISVPSAE